eukprot:12420520-Karenia_brevis.AAC.1
MLCLLHSVGGTIDAQLTSFVPTLFALHVRPALQHWRATSAQNKLHATRSLRAADCIMQQVCSCATLMTLEMYILDPSLIACPAQASCSFFSGGA